MIRPNHRRLLRHSAKGSTWEEHKYVKRIDGTYYYPSGYDKGRTVDSLKGNGDSSDEDSSEEKTELSSDDIDALALEVIRGNFGNGQIRKDLLGENYQAIQDKVNQLMKALKVNQMSISKTSSETEKKGSDALEKASAKVEKVTVASKGIDIDQVQSVYKKQKERGG